ncbi:MAG: hypothetical protein D4R64_04930 [Porphyromonadaceae bacterium]|nr:MAG: hypothetical protein D4R64_04930 [Porphyromonadaceae bacterium]
MQHLRDIRDSYKESLNTLNKEISNKQIILEEQMVNFYNFEGFNIGKTQMFMNQKGDSINVDHILGQGRKIVFNFSEYNCDACVKEELISLKIICNIIGSKNIIILGNFERIRDLGIILKSAEIDCQYYNSAKSSVIPEIENKNLPFIFINDLGLNAKSLFIINKNSNDLTKHFYQIILKKYFKIVRND